jgi:autotransporter-associated beta strand protein
MKKTLLIALSVLTALSAQAEVIDQWTFTNATTPQISDILSKTMGNWNPATKPGTTVPSTGVLRDATGGNSTGAYYGDNLGLAEMPDSITLTVEITDITHTQRDYWFQFLGPGLGTTRLDINAFDGGISIDLWGAGTKYYDGSAPIFDTDDYTGAISLTLSATWDFANNTLSYTMSGDGEGYTGTGSSAFSDTQTVSGDLSAITNNIAQLRVQGGTVAAGEYIDLDTVTLEAGPSGTFTVDAGTTVTESGNPSGAVIKQGAGTLVLTGNNSFTGAVAVNEGVLELASTVGGAAASAASVAVASGATLLLSQSDQVNNSATVTLSGGTIQRGSGVSEVFGNLSLTTDSFLDFGTGTTGTLSFGTYTPSALLTVSNFGSGNTLTFGSDLTDTIDGALFSFDSAFTSSWNSGTSTFTITAIPEPSTYLAAAGLLAVLMWPSRRRLLKDAKSFLLK